MMTASDFSTWAFTAYPGSRVEYFRGFMLNDIHRDRNLRDLAGTALRLADKDKVYLTQKKHGYGDYSYYAQKPSYQE